MTRQISILLYILCMSTFAQTSIGFKNPENKMPLKDYRLPTWGYHSWEMDFDLDGFIKKGDSQTIPTDEYDEDGRNSLLSNKVSTLFRIYRESDHFTFSSTPFINLGLTFSRSESEKSETHNKSKEFEFNPRFNVPIDLNYYFHPQHGISLRARTQFYYVHTKTTIVEPKDAKKLEISRIWEYSYRLGYTLGRVRNVTPVIRALRMRERLESLSQNSSLSNTQIQELAQHISKYSGYRTVYARYDKYFWRDLQNITGHGALNPWDVFYIEEIFREMIYERYEGWALNVGVNAYREYRNQYNMQKDDSYIGPFAAFDWYHNFNLRNQLHIHGDATYDVKATAAPTFFNERLYAKFAIQYDWMIADRAVWYNTVSFRTNRVDMENQPSAFHPLTSLNQEYSASFFSAINFRIEDRILLKGDIHCRYDSYHQDKTWDELNYRETKETQHDFDEFNLGYSISLSYILDRHLR